MGPPDAIRGNLMSKHGQTIEIWEYKRYKGGISLNEIKIPTEYWFYFVDGQLENWSEASEWKRSGR